MGNKVWSLKEIKAFWVNARVVSQKAGIEDKEFVYEIIRNSFNKERLRELSREEFVVLFTRMRELAEEETPGRLTPKQKKKIFTLKKELGMSDSYLLNFCKKITGVSHPNWLTWQQARILIGALSKKLKYQRDVQD